jgi:ribose transport system ATP-binding protein
MFLELRGVTKTFPGVVALNGVDIGFAKGEIHALVGENGAGKSTLIKIIGGKYQPDSGEVFFKDRRVRITDPLKALELGISTVYQEYNLIPNLKVIENILLGSEPIAGLWRIDWKKAEELCRDLMARMDVDVNLHQYASELGAAEAKMIEILKALVANAAVVIMDEPTAALPEHEVDSLFTLIRSLKGSGVTVIYISHRIEEIFAVADRVSVLKDGNMVGTHALKEIDRDRLIKLMIGRELKDIYPPRKETTGGAKKPPDVMLSVRSLGDGGRLRGITFDLHGGEILGIGGMTGNGQRELIRALFGAHRTVTGRIFFEGREVAIDSPRKALRLGIGFIPDDRRNEGLAVTQPVRSNIALPSLHLRQRGGVIQGKREKSVVEETVKTLDIRLTSVSQRVQNLSGGNQQRVVIAKWIPLNPKLLLFHEPTLGIDVGAKLEIYRLIHRFTELGVSVVMVSSDMMELLNVPDRILVLFEGSISGEFTRAEASEEAVMYAASGYGKNDEKR